MSDLTRKRGSCKAKLTSFKRFVSTLIQKELLDEVEQIELRERLEKIDLLYDEFNAIQSQIECDVDENDLDNEYLERETFENAFHSEVSLANKLLGEYSFDNVSQKSEDRKSKCGSDSMSNNGDNNNHYNSLKLPSISLSKFDGTYDSWLEFRDTYKSLIHDNTSLSEIQKYHYLRSSLESGAAQIIRSLEFTSKNYEIAWKALCERYNNTRLLVHNHIKAIFDLEPMRKESSLEIRGVIDTVSKNLNALDSLKQPTDKWDTLINFLVAEKLDKITAREWEQYKCKKELPTWEEFKKFLKSRADLLETLEHNSKLVHGRTLKVGEGKGHVKGLYTGRSKCIVCKQDHVLVKCDEFQGLGINDRIELVKKNKLCMNCLKGGHFAKTCKFGSCKKCKMRHNVLVHIEKDETHIESGEKTNLTGLTSLTSNNVMLLSTARVKVWDKFGRFHIVRALLDSAAQSNFMSTSLCKKLGLPIEEINFTIEGIDRRVSKANHKCSITFKSLQNAFSKDIDCVVLDEITGYIPEIRVDKGNIRVPKNICLADPDFDKPDKIDLLLGIELFYNLLNVGQICVNKKGLILQKTKLGWVFGGPIEGHMTNKSYCSLSINNEIQQTLTRFWEIEDISSETRGLSQEEIACENHFKNNVKRTEEGRFIVSLPLKESPEALGESRSQATKRFYALERKFAKNPHFKVKYSKFIQEYIDMGHMAEVTSKGTNRESGVEYFMPHHGVFKDDSLTTALRVVFDASFRTSSGKSLNDLQMVGPALQNDLFRLLIRFRKHRYIVSADIEKMYRQILVDESQRSLQQIVWRDIPSETLKTFQCNTVTYGHAAAPYLALRCLRELSNEIENELPIIAETIRDDFFVDDLLTGGDSILEVSYICKNVACVLQSGSFILRKWYTNEPRILQNISISNEQFSRLDFGEHENAKTLGLIWSCSSDKLMYKIGDHKNIENVTKRVVLSHIAQIFDPLGLLSPCIIIVKILLQKLWALKIAWDDNLPIELLKLWDKFWEGLKSLNKLEIPRWVMCTDWCGVEMHCFSDASNEAYGGCIYVRTRDKTGTINVKLLCAKSKVAPVKPMTTPRLELCGALITARLAEKVKISFKSKFDNCIYWTDSKVVLGWLAMQPGSLNTFVCNRVAEIQALSNAHMWRYVPSKENPADLVSRGIYPSDIHEASLWWGGPPFLSGESDIWHISPTQPVDLPELKKNLKCFVATDNDTFLFEKYSDYNKLCRITAFVLRFIKNCRLTKENRVSGYLTRLELTNAVYCLAKISQRVLFADEINRLKNLKDIRKESSIISLNPFLDENGVLRVGGRIRNSNFSFEKRHPILISHKHPFSKFIFESEHKRLLHAGPQLLLASVRQRFWPTSGRNLARKYVKTCLRCFRFNTSHITPIMGDLPEDRLVPGQVFNVVGVDYAGPFQIRDKKSRGCKIVKCYVSLFVCFSTKAVHLELVSDLSTECFILALRRFVARRGAPARMYSDNGRNFVGANRELKSLGKFLAQNQETLTECYLREGIEWHFIPAYAPHFGGLWEAGVKCTKHHLKRVAGDANLTFEEMYSLIVQIESILNSRPLCPLSSDPNDLSPLTPAHFLVGKVLTDLPDPDVTHIPAPRLSVYQRIQKIRQHFWKRWSSEYVHELQQRIKWRTTQGNLLVDALVIVREDNAPPLKWRLGRIVDLHPGKDGVNRVASIKTSDGIIKRDFSKVCPLPVSEQ